MKILSLFDGISCGMVALERAEIPVERYVAYEIDKYAIQVSQKNYPQIEHCGDVTTADFTQYKGFDLLIGGSPCQGFSFAGKQLNFNDARSKLFFEFVRAIKEVKPKYFLLENVVMKKEYQDVISKILGVEPIKINSKLLSAQNRDRLYWTNILGIMQPKPLNLTLEDICINENVEEKYYLSNERVISISNSTFNQERKIVQDYICSTLLARDYKDPKCIKVNQLGNIVTTGNFNNSQRGRIYSKNGLSPTSNCCGGGGLVTKILEGERIRKLTPLEYERLQTLPDNYTDGISNTQRYKCIGNGWTVDVIAHILKGLRRLLSDNS